MDSYYLILVDDDEVSLIVTRQFVKRHEELKGAKIEYFSNPKEAIDSVRNILEAGPQAALWILLDINMPIMDGWDFLDELKKFNEDHQAKVIMLTSSINEDDRVKAENYDSVYGFLSKPINPENVNEIVQTMKVNSPGL